MSSLVDALLNEPWRDPLDIYIALRADGQRGSGTMSDPYDGGTRLGTALEADITFDDTEAIVFFRGPLPGTWRDTQWKTISGVAGPAAAVFNGNYQITLVNDRCFKITLPATPALAPAANSYIYAAEREFNITLTVPAGPVPFTVLATLQSGQVTSGTGHRYRTGDRIRITKGDFSEVFELSSAEEDSDTFEFVVDDAAHATGLGASGAATCALATAALQDVSLYWPVAMADTGAAHGYGDFTAVRLVGEEAAFTGDFVALAITADSFRIRLRTWPSGSFPQIATSSRIHHRLDEVLRATPTHSLIHLGTGTFETRGFASIYIANPNDYSQVHVGFALRRGQRLLGSGMGGTTLQLVLVVEELGQTSVIGNGESADGAEVADLTVDANAAGHPAPFGIFPAPVTCGGVALGGSFIRLYRVRAIHFCTQARPECFVLRLGEGKSFAAPVHNVIDQCMVERPGLSNTHETTIIGNVGHHGANGISPVVRHNYVNCEHAPGHSSGFLAVAAVSSPEETSPGRYEFVIETRRKHQRAAGQSVHLERVVTATGTTHPLLNGDFEVLAVDSPTQLRCRFIPPAGGVPDPFPEPATAQATLGVRFQSVWALSGTGCVAEGNAVFDCFAPNYSDTGITRDVVVRNNYFSNITFGIFVDFSGDGKHTENRKAASLTRSIVDGKIVATFTIPDSAPLLEVFEGDAVEIVGAFVGDTPSVEYNIKTIVSSIAQNRRSFSYHLVTDPGENANAPTMSSPIEVLPHYQIRRMVIESNLYDLRVMDMDTPLAYPSWTTSFLSQHVGWPFIFPQAAFRGNVIRHLDYGPSQILANGNGSVAFALGSFSGAIVEHNIAEVSHPHPFFHGSSENISSLGNRRLGGALLTFEEQSPSQTYSKSDTIETRIADALLMAFI